MKYDPKFKLARSVDAVEEAKEGEIVYLDTWYFIFEPDSLYVIAKDLYGIRMPLKNVPDSFRDQIKNSNDYTLIASIYAKVTSAYQYNSFGCVPDEKELSYYTPTCKKCNCGAAHTSFPHAHSSWCDSGEFE